MAPKQTRLDDSAEIYKRREPQSERQKLSEMSGSEKIKYFKEYYLKKTLVTLVLVVFLIYLVYTIFSPKPETILSISFANYSYSDEIKSMEDDLKEYFSLDEETQSLRIDTGYDLASGDYASLEKITTYIAAGEIDIFIAPESVFLKYAFSDCMSPLTDLLPTDMYSKLQDKLFTCKTRLGDEETPDLAQGPEGVYGIYIQDTDIFSQYNLASDPPVLGIIVSGKNSDNSVRFIRHLFHLD